MEGCCCGSVATFTYSYAAVKRARCRCTMQGTRYQVHNMSKGVSSRVGCFSGEVLGQILELPDPGVVYRYEMIMYSCGR